MNCFICLSTVDIVFAMNQAREVYNLCVHGLRGGKKYDKHHIQKSVTLLALLPNIFTST